MGEQQVHHLVSRRNTLGRGFGPVRRQKILRRGYDDRVGRKGSRELFVIMVVLEKDRIPSRSWLEHDWSMALPPIPVAVVPVAVVSVLAKNGRARCFLDGGDSCPRNGSGI